MNIIVGVHTHQMERQYPKEEDLFAARFQEASDGSNFVKFGTEYEYGRGCSQDLQKAAMIYHLAAGQGNLEAQLNLALLYSDGKGVQKDLSMSIHLLLEAAAQGYGRAINNLGWAYLHGLGVEKDISKAASMFMDAAEKGAPAAKYNLACCYADGVGVDCDPQKAHEWFGKAKEQQQYLSSHCCILFAERCLAGNGLKKDVEYAKVLLRQAAKRGYTQALDRLATLKLEEDNEANALTQLYRF